nr:meiosis-specific topoisomerase [Sporisorium scitamineum]
MTSNSATVLARIDELILDLMRQLVIQTEVLRSTPAACSSSSSSSATDSQTTAERPARPAKRSKQAGVKVTPLRLATFATTEGGADQTVSVMSRDIFYQALHLFPTQQSSDRIITHLTTLLGCTDRLQLNIVASPRGVVSGPITIIPPVGEAITCQFGVTTIIPTEIGTGWSVAPHHEAHLVLVVEKEAVFKHLLQTAGGEGERERGGRGVDWTKVVMLTAKGYPDYATRWLLQLITVTYPGVGVVGLFDGDPYGVDIWRQYARDSGGRVEWVGVDLADFLCSNALVPLRNDERATAVRLLRGLGGSREDEHVRARLTDMLLWGYKAEIEAAYEFAPPSDLIGTRSGLIGYIEYKLFNLRSSQQ